MSKTSINLNLGCGHVKLPGYLNVDFSKQINPDMVADLSVRPWPFPDNSADEIRMDGSLEHLRDTCENLNEVHRILKPGGIFRGCVPYAKSDGAFLSIEHKSFYTEKSFDYVCSQEAYPSFEGAKFEKISVRLTSSSYRWKNKTRNLIPIFIRHILKWFLWNMFDEVEFVLRKPAAKVTGSSALKESP
jgi:SAM-dependent methyltransferase